MILRLSFFGDPNGFDISDLIEAVQNGRLTHVAPHFPDDPFKIVQIEYPRAKVGTVADFAGKRLIVTLSKRAEGGMLPLPPVALAGMVGKRYDWTRCLYIAAPWLPESWLVHPDRIICTDGAQLVLHAAGDGLDNPTRATVDDCFFRALCRGWQVESSALSYSWAGMVAYARTLQPPTA
jgi:hypothetical protein